ncbi:glycine oxidase ThiO [Saccharopolyspora sp. TS4A08]|uniref:glycine oxidase n=1 Tax=Saccharopolyspora ipomoeae TaxID=3042027 RepID=A0ABT6PRR0_9PSEU|nr:glycine oxidase ThiO [Saccharopolyspora sp. TS4A08]MDI2030687.1 glycine oxidase ThiO [Saccharopolyspora sp. TS4A08]
MSGKRTDHVVVVGGGVVGLSVAWRAAEAGNRVSLVDPAPASGASHVAGGMLAPLAEAWPGEEELLELGTTSLDRWPGFADELARAAGLPSGLRTEGTLMIGIDGADRGELDTVAGYLAGLGRSVTRLTGRELRKREPALGPAVRGGLEIPGDLAVDNRLALTALQAAAKAAGVEFVAERAERVRSGAVELADSELECDLAVISAGVRSGDLHPALSGRIRPVKGEILRLRRRATALPPPVRTVRGPVRGRPCYLVPRDDGGVVLGATQHEVGFDTEVTVGGVRDLLADAETVMPGIAEYALVEATAGLRPSTADNLPLIGWLEPGVLAATGHHRGGFLLTPVTVDAVLALLRGDEPGALIKATDPSRLGGQQ